MALIKCSNCNQQIPDDALSCPNCGEEQRRRRIFHLIKTNRGLIGFVLALFAILGTLFLFPTLIGMKGDAGAKVKENSSEGMKLSEETFYNKSAHFLSVSSHLTLPLNIRKNGVLTVTVVEINGHHIEFKIRRGDIDVYQSGVQNGRASGTIEVTAGQYILELKNKNLIEPKNIHVTAMVKYN